MMTMTKPKAKNNWGLLASVEIFRKLPAAELAGLEKRMVEKKVPKHDSIFLDGDPAQFAWFVKEGHIKAITHASSGRCQALCMVGPGKMFGSCCSLGRGDYACQAIAETDATVVGLPLTDFLGLLGRYPALAAEVLAQVSQRLRHSKESQVFEQQSVEKRITRVLADLVSEFGNVIPLTKREVAEMAGTTVETCIRTFSRLEEEGLVATERGKITVRKPELLEERLDEE
ncbi:MAG TPA: Crp/Fnr family transcriptional regulator [bacterium]|nr:Crp/Fnr family transcriptional regulator [bacterium]